MCYISCIRKRKPSLLFAFLLLSYLMAGATELPNEKVFYIGVLAKRGEQIALQRWTQTATYLNQQIPTSRFRIVPLTFKEINPAIQQKKIDFLLANSGIYIEAEHKFGAFRIATLINHIGKHAQISFGGVVFTRADNHQLQSLSDLKGSSFAAVSSTSLGGYLMARRELSEQGIDTEGDMHLHFLGTHDAVVNAVLAGQVDAGTVRSDTLTRMAKTGLINLDRVKVLNANPIEGFPFLLSTPLYPEWPMAALAGTPKSLVKQVTIALLNMPTDHPAALSSHTAGWTVPANYQPVHELYRALNLPPHHQNPPSLNEWTRDNPITTSIISTVLLLLLISILLLTKTNRRLSKTQRDLTKAVTAKEAMGMSVEKWLLNLAEDENQDNSILRYIGNSDDPLPDTLLEFETTRKSGERFPIEAAISSVRLHNGWYVICLLRDITQRKAIETEKQLMSLQLSQHNKMTALSQLANGIAHEINTPIQTINNNLEFLKEAFEDNQKLIQTLQDLVIAARKLPELSVKVEAFTDKCEEIDKEFLDKEIPSTLLQSRQGTEQISQIVRSMRIFATHDNPIPEKTDLNKLIQDVLAISRHLWHPIARVEAHYDNDLPRISCFPGELHQALLNLLINAVQAIESKSDTKEGEITITSQLLGDKVQVEIKDNGIGIPEDAREHIFNPFFTTHDVGNGTGQGLSLCHDIVVQKHGGTIDFKTEIGVGTTFFLQLPVSVTEPDKQEAVPD
ncbi:MAG: PhnD/SsuA/transferrin family substrate-binding protein [Candidatus Thiodiazotropha sp.]